MASNPVTETEAAVFNPDILHQLTLKYRMPNLIATNVFDRRYESVKIGDNIDVASVTRLAVQTMTLGTGFKATQFQNATETKTTIAINKWSYGAVALEVYEEAVAAKDLEAIYKQSSLDTVMVKIDTDAMAELDNFTSSVIGTDNVSLTDDDIISSVKFLDAGNVPPTERSAVFHTNQNAEFFKLDKWVNNLYRGATPINAFNIGEIYGLQLYKTTQVKAGAAGHVNGVFHKEAIALVIRKEPSAWVMDDADTQSRKIVYPAIYGSKLMRQDHGNEMDGL